MASRRRAVALHVARTKGPWVKYPDASPQVHTNDPASRYQRQLPALTGTGVSFLAHANHPLHHLWWSHTASYILDYFRIRLVNNPQLSTSQELTEPREASLIPFKPVMQSCHSHTD
jgi:hypothetical protein